MIVMKVNYIYIYIYKYLESVFLYCAMLYNLVYAFLVMFKYIIYLIIFYPDPEHYNLDPIIPESLKRERYKLRVFEYERELNWIWKECPICLIGFKENDRVSPLPCDPRYIYIYIYIISI